MLSAFIFGIIPMLVLIAIVKNVSFTPVGTISFNLDD